MLIYYIYLQAANGADLAPFDWPAARTSTGVAKADSCGDMVATAILETSIR